MYRSNWIIKNDSLIYVKDGIANTIYTINLGKLQALLKGIAFFSFGKNFAFKLTPYADKTLEDVWNKVKDVEEL